MDEPEHLEWQEGGRNRWRHKQGTQQAIVELELTQGKVAEADRTNLDKLLLLRWCAALSTKKTHWYALAAFKDDETQSCKMLKMHRFLFGDLGKTLDHIDHNGLNNTRENVRSGDFGINNRNREGTVGVVHRASRNVYEAYWHEANGKRKFMQFRYTTNVSKEEAYAAALRCRLENAERTMKELESMAASNPQSKIERYEPPKLISNIGIRHLRRRESRNGTLMITAEIMINGKRFSKAFFFSSYNNNEDDALSAAQAYLAQIKAENPIVTRKRKKVDE